MRAKLKFKGRRIEIKDMKKISGIEKYLGLMFKPKETQALLFEFSRGQKAIHSFFCKPFLAIWLLEGKIVDSRLISPFQLSIKPKKEFDKLIEIPFNNKYSHVIRLFIDEGKI